MLRKIRIEVIESTPEACVDALNKYEHAIQQQEAKRYHHLWPISNGEDPHIEDVPWSYGVAARRYYNEYLGREIVEEVIEYDASGPEYPHYAGRRVIRYNREDTRHPIYSDDLEATAAANDLAVKELTKTLRSSGSHPDSQDRLIEDDQRSTP